MLSNSLANLLLVEDDDVEVQLLERLFKRQEWPFELTRARDGIEALDVLRESSAKPSSSDQPFLILLDLNMPRMGGIEFLRALREDESLRRTVVMVFTTSSDPHDIGNAYDLGVTGYVVKGEDDRSLGPLLEQYARLNTFPPSAAS